MKKEKPEFVFRCRKCGHLMYVPKENLKKNLLNMLKEACDECGEEGEIWILEREGDYDKEWM